MATRQVNRTKTTEKKTATTNPINEKGIKSVADSIQEQVEQETIKEAKGKKFNQDDKILCSSVSAGVTHVKGQKTGEIYTFESEGASEYIEYRDLVAAVRTNSDIIFKPFIIVKDKDFIDEQDKLKKFYDSLYTIEDYNEFFRVPAQRMKNILDQLPDGIKNTIKSMAVTKIANGSLDSVARIKALDEYFGTQLSMLTGLFDE